MLTHIKQNKLYVSVVIIFFLTRLLMLHFFCFVDTIGTDEFFFLSIAPIAFMNINVPSTSIVVGN